MSQTSKILGRQLAECGSEPDPRASFQDTETWDAKLEGALPMDDLDELANDSCGLSLPSD